MCIRDRSKDIKNDITKFFKDTVKSIQDDIKKQRRQIFERTFGDVPDSDPDEILKNLKTSLKEVNDKMREAAIEEARDIAEQNKRRRDQAKADRQFAESMASQYGIKESLGQLQGGALSGVNAAANLRKGLSVQNKQLEEQKISNAKLEAMLFIMEQEGAADFLLPATFN